MLTLDNKALLVVAPHPDDEVIGCGGLMSALTSAGGKVYVLFMTVGATEDVGKERRVSSTAQRLQEIARVARIFRFSGFRTALAGDKYHLQLDQVPQKRLIHEIERGPEISLEALKPDILAFPGADDYNQDHRAVALAALTACRPVSPLEKHTPPLILSYESPMNGWSPSHTNVQPNLYLRLTPEQLSQKLRGMRAYRSQMRRRGHVRSVSALEALARLRGSLIGAEFAEAYYCLKLAVEAVKPSRTPQR